MKFQYDWNLSFFKIITVVFFCLSGSNFVTRIKRFIQGILSLLLLSWRPNSHISLKNRKRSLLCYLQEHLLLKIVTLQVFTHHSETAETFYLRNCQYNSKLVMYLVSEWNKNKVRRWRVRYCTLTGAEVSRPFATYLDNYYMDNYMDNYRNFQQTTSQKKLIWTQWKQSKNMKG